MRQLTTIVALVVLVAAVAGPIAAAQPTTGAPAQPSNQPDALPPGERLAGIFAVQETELQGEIETRAFAVRLDRADSNVSKAEVLLQQLDAIDGELDAVRQRLHELEAARQRGEITEREYRVRVARLAARIATIRRLANDTDAASVSLPLELLVASGVDLERVYALRENADNASGPEVRLIARRIAGTDVGPATPDVAPQERVKAAIIHAERSVVRAEELIHRASSVAPSSDREVSRELSLAKRNLRAARTALEGAHAAVRHERYRLGFERATQANRHAQLAIRHAHRAGRLGQQADAYDDRASAAIRHAEGNIQRAEDALRRAGPHVADDDRQAQLLLTDAKDNLRSARRMLDAARSAHESGDNEEAIGLALRSSRHAELAVVHAKRAVAASNDDADRRAADAIAKAEGFVREAVHAVSRARELVPSDDRDAAAALEHAEVNLRDAQSTLEDARSALRAGHPERAVELATTSAEHARAATALAKRAVGLVDADDDSDATDREKKTAVDEA